MAFVPSTLNFAEMDEQVPADNWILTEYSSVDLYNDQGIKIRSQKDPNKPHKKRPINQYSYPVLVENHHLRRFAKDAENIDICYKKLIKGSRYWDIRRMYEEFLTNVWYETSQKQLHYGKVYQIYNDEVPTSAKPACWVSNKKGFYLSAIVTIQKLDNEGKTRMEDGCQLMGSLIRKPLKRNTFVFELHEHEDFDGIMNFEDIVYIKTAYTEKPLYIRCGKDIATQYNSSQAPEIYLSELKDGYCRFKIHSYDKTYRENLLWPIFPRKTILIEHLATKKYLACTHPDWHQTWFGIERLISVTSLKDSNGCNKIEHHWLIKTDKGDEIDPVIIDPLDAALNEEMDTLPQKSCCPCETNPCEKNPLLPFCTPEEKRKYGAICNI